MYTYCNVHFYNFRGTNNLVTSKKWEKFYYKQTANVISYQKELTQKEQKLIMLRKKTTILQFELGQHYDIFTAEKAEKEKMICELNSKLETINKLQTNIRMHKADTITLNQQLQHQSVELEKLQIRSQSQMDEMKIIMKKMQKWKKRSV